MNSSQRTVVIAWQGLPFYARRCLRHFRETYPDHALTVVSARLDAPLAEAAAETLCPVIATDSERATTFAQLGLGAPRHFFMTSWSHAAYRALAAETRAAGGAVTMLVDNNDRGAWRQRVGAWWFRATQRRALDDAWTPGAKGRALLRRFGVPENRIHEGLYCADETIFSPPVPAAPREGVVYTGQFIARKAVRELWRAWSAAPRRSALAMIGDGPLKAALAMAGAPVRDALAPAALAERLRGADALILPSRVDHWGLVLHEAASCGCLLLATKNCGAAHDFIEPGVNGHVMARCDEHGLGAALAWLDRLSPEEKTRGRARSVELAKKFNRARWSETLAAIVRRQETERAACGHG
jgi:glycosyltransferase involved in cell wall biosynthesis